jgi:hypothetical protein
MTCDCSASSGALGNAPATRASAASHAGRPTRPATAAAAEASGSPLGLQHARRLLTSFRVKVTRRGPGNTIEDRVADVLDRRDEAAQPRRFPRRARGRVVLDEKHERHVRASRPPSAGSSVPVPRVFRRRITRASDSEACSGSGTYTTASGFAPGTYAYRGRRHRSLRKRRRHARQAQRSQVTTRRRAEAGGTGGTGAWQPAGAGGGTGVGVPTRQRLSDHTHATPSPTTREIGERGRCLERLRSAFPRFTRYPPPPPKRLRSSRERPAGARGRQFSLARAKVVPARSRTGYALDVRQEEMLRVGTKIHAPDSADSPAQSGKQFVDQDAAPRANDPRGVEDLPGNL